MLTAFILAAAYAGTLVTTGWWLASARLAATMLEILALIVVWFTASLLLTPPRQVPGIRRGRLARHRDPHHPLDRPPRLLTHT